MAEDKKLTTRAADFSAWYNETVLKAELADYSPVRGCMVIRPRGYGIFMISLGLFALLVATVQHRQSMKLLREHYPEAPVSLAVLVAALFSTLGILALLAAIFRQ